MNGHASRSHRRKFRSHLLTSGVSLAALALGIAGANPAHAANYTAATQADLVNAINQANADGDATSTITLTGNLTVTSPGSLPAISKPLVIDAASFRLDTPGSIANNVASGATLTLKGDVDGQGGLALNGDNASVTVTGPGSSLNAGGASTVGSVAGSVLTIEAGASTTVANALTMGSIAGTRGTLTVRGPGTTLSTSGLLGSTRGTGIITIADGATVTSASGSIGGNGAVVSQGGTGTFTVTGRGTTWTTAQFGVHDGSLSILDGAVLSTSFIRIGTTNARTGNVVVSGAGSQLIGTSNGGANFTEVGGNGAGSLTVANGGLVSVGVAGAGTIRVATGATSSGVINIGGGTGQAATASGTLTANRIQFGAGAGVINFNHTDAAYGFDIALTGSGTLNQIGSGKTRLTADQLGFNGKTNVRAGILEVNGKLGGTMDVLGGRLQGIGTVGTTHNLAGGTIAPGNSIGTLTVNGDYVSDGGKLEIEAMLGNDGSPADRLLITGNSLLGLAPTLVSVTNLGGLGEETVEGIKIVDVQGATSDAAVFALTGPAIGGAYRYDLFQNDIASDGDWYLRNTGVLAPTTPTFENYPVALLGMIDLPTLRQRVGDRPDAAHGLWTRIEGAAGHHAAASSSTGAAYDSSLFLAQLGLEGALLAGTDGSLTAGLTAQYSRAAAQVFSGYGDGSNATESFGIGAALTWRGTDGTYLDL